MKKIINYYIKTKKYYKKIVIILKLKILSSKNLEYSINNYGDIKDEIEKLLKNIIEEDESYKYMYLLIISLYENIDTLLENLIIANHDICLKIIRSISEQLIIFKCLMQNEEYLREDFFNWSILNDYKNPKKEVELANTAKELYDKYILKLKEYMLDKEKNIDKTEMKRNINKLINNNYGWYYTKCKNNYNISLNYIAKNENCNDIYEMFKYYSEEVHNNNTRTLIIQCKHNLSMEYHVIELLLFVQHHILQIIKEYVPIKRYKYILNKIEKNIQYNYDKMTYYEKKFDK